MCSQEEIRGNSHTILIATASSTHGNIIKAKDITSSSSSHPQRWRSQVCVGAAIILGLLYTVASGMNYRSPMSPHPQGNTDLAAVPSYPQIEAESFFDQTVLEDTDENIYKLSPDSNFLLSSPTRALSSPPSRNNRHEQQVRRSQLATKISETLSLEETLKEKLRLENVVKRQEGEIVRKRALRSNMRQVNMG